MNQEPEGSYPPPAKLGGYALCQRRLFDRRTNEREVLERQLGRIIGEKRASARGHRKGVLRELELKYELSTRLRVLQPVPIVAVGQATEIQTAAQVA